MSEKRGEGEQSEPLNIVAKLRKEAITDSLERSGAAEVPEGKKTDEEIFGITPIKGDCEL